MTLVILSIVLAFGVNVKSNEILNSLNNVISSSYLLEHDFLRCFSNGDFKDMEEAASIFASNHFKYSKNFANYLQTVADKIDDEDEKKQIVEPILKEMDEELGIYNDEAMNKLSQIGIDQEWYNKIPHKYLNKRFFDSLNIDKSKPKQSVLYDLKSSQTVAIKEVNEDILLQKDVITSTDPGDSFTQFMIKLYNQANQCQVLFIMGYTEIGLLIQKIYHQIWDGLKYHTKLSDDQIVIFPLHVIIDNAKSIKSFKTSLEKYMKQNPDLCKYEDIEQIIKTVLQRRIKMYDDIRAQIETKQNYHCKQPYHSPSKFEQQNETDWNSVNDTEEVITLPSNKMVITNLVETDNKYIEYIEFIDRRYIAIFIHIIGYLYVILHD